MKVKCTKCGEAIEDKEARGSYKFPHCEKCWEENGYGEVDYTSPEADWRMHHYES